MIGSWIVCAGLVLAASASAADTVYWANEVGSTISFANLNGSGGGGNLSTTGAERNSPEGMAIDPATGKIYWSNLDGNTISWADLDGGGGGILSTSGVTPNAPTGVAVDPADGKIYWANQSGDTISFANLDGSGGGGTLNTTGATKDGPVGVALDPANGKIYWTNFEDDKISFANLDDSGGGGDLPISGTTLEGPYGLAIDPETEKIYWSNFSCCGDTISFANLDGSGGGILSTPGVSPSGPSGVAIDPAAGKIYWANGNANKIAVANLDGSGGSDLTTTGATPDGPRFLALLNVPGGAGVPVISGGPAVGSSLSCTQGLWATDLLPASDYLAPERFVFGWSESGTAIPGATSSSIVAGSPGSYTCQVTASNQAGPTTQSSAPVTIGTPSQPSTGAAIATPVPAPVITGLRETAKAWREGGLLAQMSARRTRTIKRLPVGTTFAFSLNVPATVTFSFTESARGRKVGRKCVSPTSRNRRAHRCTRTLVAGTLAFSAHAGTNRVRFEGSLSRHHKLGSGSYTLVVDATSAGGHAVPGTLRFTIAGG